MSTTQNNSRAPLGGGSNAQRPLVVEGAAKKLRTLRDRKKADTRDALARAAAELMLEEGSDGASIRAITRRARVSSRTFHNYFPNRDAAFLYFIETYVRQIAEWIGRTDPGLTPVQLLRQITHEIMTSGDNPLPAINLASSLGEHMTVQMDREGTGVLLELFGSLTHAVHRYCDGALNLVEIHLLINAVTAMVNAATEIANNPGYAGEEALEDILNTGFDRLERGFGAN
ncbi:TetR/AcrR family transcriptional regulator [Corynebacterium sp. UMB9976]|uniref:TetR/AcrR family transcriptional regulator n=1 Tax=Corynebacterium sp. UMB9976 TaxID=3046354 RepID=UPI00254D4239|nr:TetR/AcrR family transcriptional regulator [Corynebacterium sp. UMB9976]MDK6302304.1 TetR/AcrR family transcriptional regulator [Corynebacterium sp. UMB9976]